jgi:hypothetical protein
MTKIPMVAKIDRTATREALLAAGFYIKGWATAKGINDGTLKQFFYGNYPRPHETGGPCTKKIISELRKSKLLRLLPEYQEAA